MEDFTVSLRAGLDVTDDAFTGAARTPLRGSAEQVAGDLAQYQQAGLDYLVAEPRAATADELIAQLERFAEIERP